MKKAGESGNWQAKHGEHREPENRLAKETSPYLLQHARNPVDWYAWGPEAFSKARDENKPIFLSIGYSACHWCHVMERESFENKKVADVLNEHFVSIKVDREERPDVDRIYMNAVQMMTGSGGWPLTAFLTPDLKPFYGGTYFPPEDRYGRPGFKSLLGQIAEAWRDRRGDVDRSAAKMTDALKRSTATTGDTGHGLDHDAVARAAEELTEAFDSTWGGFGRAPKFPPSATIAYLLRQARRTADPKTLRMAEVTLNKMAEGGMYDHLGGGFHRYSVDEKWLVPHFEKMLYDNAALGKVYVEAYLATGNVHYREIAEQTLDYVIRDMTDPGGAFYSSEDADSEGEEGKFYVWTPEEITGHLGSKDAELFTAFYGVTARGNFEGKSILTTRRPAGEFARAGGMSEKELKRRLAGMRKTLLEARSKRVAPGKDDKIITAWNGLMISALANAHEALAEERFRAAAEKAADFILTQMTDDKGGLLRIHRGGRSKLPAYLDDYAFMANALLDLYQATFNVRWLDASERLMGDMVERFWDEKGHGFFFTSENHADLLTREKTFFDSALPSGNSVAALALLRLATLTGSETYQTRAEQILGSASGLLAQHPRAVMNMLLALDRHLEPVREIALIGNPDAEDMKMLLKAIRAEFLPGKVMALLDPGSAGTPSMAERIPWLGERPQLSGRATAYVCENRACKAPVTTADELRGILQNTSEQ
ncbi:MAG: thioredoxin domain-containing protein [Lentisphaerae bacterium]|nr:thioredoxin domain-containing protein [Lentisphaerota bacterium]MBT5611000.1 thioredoxin domain-containing protein [Lentisphaerota bacterium]MBT7061528.1 thioredoxin domain-containing protein [Lentisphaerota bacterium]MBT7845597.1 thioredoxin domain-containing protein [Lentisphaerota bacterium]